MPCPSCGSNDLWDDMMWWGCNGCGWTNGGTARNKISASDRFGSVKMPERESRPYVEPVEETRLYDDIWETR
jgi:hypothetical protein